MVSFKNQCITLRTQGLSLNQIVQKTNRPKTSVYFHIKKIPLNEVVCGKSDQREQKDSSITVLV